MWHAKVLLKKGMLFLLQNGFHKTLRKVIKFFRRKLRLNHLSKTFIVSESILREQREVIFANAPVVSILVPLYNTPEKYLREMIESVCSQSYSNWQLCLADGSDCMNNIEEIIYQYIVKFPDKIEYRRLTNKGISENTNACIEMANGDYLALLDHDDILAPNALFEAVKAITDLNADFIYTDEAVFSKNIKNIITVHFKPDFAIDNLRSNNYICHFTVFKRELIEKVGLFRKECDGSQDHDMILRLTEVAENIVHIPKVLYFWRAHINSVAGDIKSKQYVAEAGIKAVSDHLIRLGIKAKVESSNFFPVIYRIKYDLLEKPVISIIISNSNSTSELKVCLDSILEKSTYLNYEIIIVDYSSCLGSESFNYYKEIGERANVHVLNYKGNTKNCSSIYNFGASHANGKYIIFLHSDTKVISQNWIEEMLMYAQRTDVGAVGAKLYYANDTIQHAGICINSSGKDLFRYLHRGEIRYETGYMGRLIYAQNLSAVSMACTMISKSIFDKYGGFDNELGDDYCIVDFCLRMCYTGLVTVLTPYAELYHYDKKIKSKKQLSNYDVYVYFKKRWKRVLENGDPYYGSNLISNSYLL